MHYLFSYLRFVIASTITVRISWVELFDILYFFRLFQLIQCTAAAPSGHFCTQRRIISLPFILFIYLFLIFYLFMIVTHRERERERGRDTGRGRSRLHAPGTRCGIRSRVSRIAPWAKGRRQTAAPPRDPSLPILIGTSCPWPGLSFDSIVGLSRSLSYKLLFFFPVTEVM